MAVPDFQSLMLPLLRIAGDGTEHSLSDARGRLAAEFSEIQTKIAQRQFEREERLAKVESTANWGELRNAMWNILDQFPPSGIETIRSMPQEYQLSLFKKLRTL